MKRFIQKIILKGDINLHVFNTNGKQENFQDCPKNKFDSKNRKILNGTFHKNEEGELEVASHQDLVAPAYLLEIVEKPVINELLWRVFQSVSKENEQIKTTDYTWRSIKKELKKEIAEKKPLKIQSLKSTLEEKIECKMGQLSFDITELFESKNYANTKYRIKLLQKQDDDYKILLRLTLSSNNKNFKNIEHIFKVSANNKSKKPVLKDKYLFFHGVKLSKVQNILANGYLKFNCQEDEYNYYLKASNCLEDEIDKGVSYCMQEDSVKKLSFVFVGISEENCEDFPLEDSKFVKDSGGSYIELGRSSRGYLQRQVSGFTPAYLIIFKPDEDVCY